MLFLALKWFCWCSWSSTGFIVIHNVSVVILGVKTILLFCCLNVVILGVQSVLLLFLVFNRLYCCSWRLNRFSVIFYALKVLLTFLVFKQYSFQNSFVVIDVVSIVLLLLMFSKQFCCHWCCQHSFVVIGVVSTVLLLLMLSKQFCCSWCCQNSFVVIDVVSIVLLLLIFSKQFVVINVVNTVLLLLMMSAQFSCYCCCQHSFVVGLYTDSKRLSFWKQGLFGLVYNKLFQRICRHLADVILF